MALDIDLTVNCDECKNEAEHARCEKHFENALSDAFDEGKKQGYDEGYEAARAEFEKSE